MQSITRTLFILVCLSLMMSGCGAPEKESPYKDSAEEQKAKADKAQRELSRETSRY